VTLEIYVIGLENRNYLSRNVSREQIMIACN